MHALGKCICHGDPSLRERARGGEKLVLRLFLFLLQPLPPFLIRLKTGKLILFRRETCQNVLKRPAMLRFQLVEGVESLLGGAESILGELKPVEIGRDIAVEAVEEVIDLRELFCEVPDLLVKALHLLQRLQGTADGLAGGRGIVIAGQAVRKLRRLGDLLRVEKPLIILFQLLVLADLRIDLLDLGDLEGQEIHPARALRLGDRHRRERLFL